MLIIVMLLMVIMIMNMASWYIDVLLSPLKNVTIHSATLIPVTSRRPTQPDSTVIGWMVENAPVAME